tara:strand:- start:60 stop:533 length:474 start_codon:yes stop_codon:yes gene_type:complete
MMIITCVNCSKTFNIQEKLIPKEGRLLQCGACNHKWFFKTSKLEDKIKKEIDENLILTEKDEKSIKEKDDLIGLDKSIIKNDVNIKKTINKKNYKRKKKPKIIKNFIVLIISIIAIIIFLDTFKYQLNNYIPGINSILNNLYETLKDLSLFLKDLIN